MGGPGDWEGTGSIEIEWAECAGSWAFDDVKVNHGGFHAGVSQEGLDGADVGAGLEQVSGEGVPHGVTGGMLWDRCLANSRLELALERYLVEVVSGKSTGSRVRAECRGSEEVLPRPLSGGIRPFSQQRFRHVDVTRSTGKILKVFLVCLGEMIPQVILEGFRQGDDAVPAAFPIVDGDGPLSEIEILHAEPEGFHDPQAGAIHELGRKFPRILQVGDDRPDFFTGHDDRRAASSTGRGDVIEGEFLDPEDVSDEEGHGIEGLLLCGQGDVPFQS